MNFADTTHKYVSISSPQYLFRLCRENDWHQVRALIASDPELATISLTMENNVSTTVLHQAITSKGNMNSRVSVIMDIIHSMPAAASIKNGFGSLPLHVISQRNLRMTSAVKESIMNALIECYPAALSIGGGVGGRTPLHVAFTDYMSVQVIKKMIELGPRATGMPDKKGWLPIHLACSRHSSPEKLHMLLRANPSSLSAKTHLGETPLSLAITTATKSHPNFSLIEALRRATRSAESNVGEENNQRRSNIHNSKVTHISARGWVTCGSRDVGKKRVADNGSSLEAPYTDEEKEQALVLLNLRQESSKRCAGIYFL